MKLTRLKFVMIFLFVFSLIPANVYAAEGTAFNPPNWFAVLAVLLSLGLPLGLYLWMKGN